VTTAGDNAGADTISGGAGADTIIGGSGADVLSGGTGADRFQYISAADSGITTTTAAAAGFDVVTIGATDTLAINGTTIVDLAAQTRFTATAPASDTGSGLLTALSTAFAANDANNAGGIEAMLLTFASTATAYAGKTFLVVDVDASDTITAADLVIEIVGAVDATTIAVANGVITFG
jgi:Ca2+-binding RTX toxin-like protein